jgi:hypothetical protein
LTINSLFNLLLIDDERTETRERGAARNLR